DFFNILAEFIRVTGDELNFQREIDISKNFRKLAAKFPYLSVPYVYEEFSTAKIIVMEFASGDKVTDIDQWISRNNNPKVIASQIVEIYMEQFLTLKLIHFDPHPGNILVQSNNQIVLLDFGMAGTITSKINNGIKNMLKAFIEKDYIRIIELLDDLGFIRKGINKPALLSIMEYFFDDIIYTVKLEKESLQSVDLSPVINELAELIYSQPFNLPIEWAYLGRTIGVLTGIISTLNPDFKVYDEFYPYAEKLLKLNLEELINNGAELLKNNSSILFNLPRKTNNLINDLERGTLKVKVDFEEVDDKIDELKNLVIKAVGMGISFFSAFGAYFLYTFQKTTDAIILGGISLGVFLFSFRYKKITRKEFIKRRMMK
ncbi:MAG: AarF/UbiB family protein, partial [Spirochaetes bacterium]|nr:AarF/UbiB family protein [Spirochaetota bacterium]